MKELTPPFKKTAYSVDLNIAYRVAKETGCKLIAAQDQFVAARVVGDGVRLVLYPHKTTAFNYHLRVRDEGSKDPVRALAVADALDSAAGLNCTFQMKGDARSALVKRVNESEPRSKERQ